MLAMYQLIELCKKCFDQRSEEYDLLVQIILLMGSPEIDRLNKSLKQNANFCVPILANGVHPTEKVKYNRTPIIERLESIQDSNLCEEKKVLIYIIKNITDSALTKVIKNVKKKTYAINFKLMVDEIVAKSSTIEPFLKKDRITPKYNHTKILEYLHELKGDEEIKKILFNIVKGINTDDLSMIVNMTKKSEQVELFLYNGGLSFFTINHEELDSKVVELLESTKDEDAKIAIQTMVSCFSIREDSEKLFCTVADYKRNLKKVQKTYISKEAKKIITMLDDFIVNYNEFICDDDNILCDDNDISEKIIDEDLPF